MVLLNDSLEQIAYILCDRDSTHHHTKRFWKKIYVNLVDMALLNSYILYQHGSQCATCICLNVSCATFCCLLFIEVLDFILVNYACCKLLISGRNRPCRLHKMRAAQFLKRGVTMQRQVLVLGVVRHWGDEATVTVLTANQFYVIFDSVHLSGRQLVKAVDASTLSSP